MDISISLSCQHTRVYIILPVIVVVVVVVIVICYYSLFKYRGPFSVCMVGVFRCRIATTARANRPVTETVLLTLPT